MAKSLFDTMSCFWCMTSLVTSFCSISQILPLHRLCEQLGLIFTRNLWGVKMFNMTRGRFWQDIFLIPCLVLIYEVTCDVILLCFTNFTTSSPFFQRDFYEIFLTRKVFQLDQRKIWPEENIGKSSFWYHVSFLIYDVICWRHIALFH